MNIAFLTQVTGILMPFAWIMGKILNAIYWFVGLFGSHNIALCIFIFTFVIKMLMLPLTIKQQKYTKLQSKMSPELTKIQEKYKGKKDEDSLRRQQAETQEVYNKYGTSPIGGCLPLLISLPIMFALYRVIYAVPAYVNEIGDWYNNIAVAIEGVNGHFDLVEQFITDNAIKVSSTLGKYSLETNAKDYTNSLIDILVKFNKDNWEAFFSMSQFSGLQSGLQSSLDSIFNANNLFGLSILDTPKWNGISVIIPILAVVTQFIQGKMQNVGNDANKKAQDDNPAAASAKTMTTIMPIMSGVFCLMLPIGVGVYWIATALFTILQTIFINKYLEHADIDEMIEKNVEKANKKKAKLGVDYGNKMAEVAKTSTASTKYSVDMEYDNTSYKKNNKRKSVGSSDYKRSGVSYSASSIAANANLLASRNTVDTDKKEDTVDDAGGTEE